MDKYTGLTSSICPFYLRESQLSISCEGLTDGTRNVMKFNKLDDKHQYQRDFCFYKTYKGCPVYQAILKKYEEENKSP